MSDHDLLTQSLSVREKISLCSGASQWDTKAFPKAGIPSVKMTDGPHGLRKPIRSGDNLGLADSYDATCFPSESLLACSFDTDLAAQMGGAIAEEAGAADVCTFLGPGLNIKRNPLCGRCFEYLSEDPYLSGHMGAAYIKAAEQKGIGTSLKHFACNSRESFRLVSDSLVDERSLREIYLAGFEYAVKEGKPSTVMCAYNKINGEYCSDNKKLLTDILRNEWGFQGLVVTDWGALNDRTRAFQAGCDLAMPGGSGYGEKAAYRAYCAGTLDIKDIDTCAERVATFAKAGSEKLQSPFPVDYDQHHLLAENIAAESAVLLKNEDHFLPVIPEKTVVIGAMAEHFRFQGSGSSKVHAYQTESFPDLFSCAGYAPGCRANGSTDQRLLAEAKQLAQTAEKVVIVAGLPDHYEAEGLDRTTMSLPEGMNLLIDEVLTVNQNVAVVLLCGCCVEIPWADKVKSILWMGLSGQAGPSALAGLLTGKYNPCGRLAETWPLQYKDVPCSETYDTEKDEEYREGLYVGYRYYEKANVPVRFPFGHGLSYTTFSYSDLHKVENTLFVTVTNTGDRPGKDAVLLYIRAPQNGIHRPVRELKGFAKIDLAPGECQTICFTLDERSLAVWNNGWKTYAGEYNAEIGSHTIPFTVDGEPKPPKTDDWYSAPVGKPVREDWLKELGYTPSLNSVPFFTVNSTIAEIMEDIPVFRFVFRRFENRIARKHGRDSADYLLTMKFALESPLRALHMLAGTKWPLADRLAKYANQRRKK